MSAAQITSLKALKAEYEERLIHPTGKDDPAQVMKSWEAVTRALVFSTVVETRAAIARSEALLNG